MKEFLLIAASLGLGFSTAWRLKYKRFKRKIALLEDKIDTLERTNDSLKLIVKERDKE